MVAGQRCRLVIGALGVGLAVMAVPVAAADPALPAEPAVVPTPVPAPAPVTDAAAPAPAAPAPDVPAAPSPAVDPAAGITPPDGVQHLPSPDSLPPGTTQEAPQHPTGGLLRDIWHALRDGEMSGPDALKLLAIRPMDPQKLAGSKPSNQTGPATAVGVDAPAAPAAEVAPAPIAPPVPDAAPAPATPVPAPTAPVPAS